METHVDDGNSSPHEQNKTTAEQNVNIIAAASSPMYCDQNAPSADVHLKSEENVVKKSETEHSINEDVIIPQNNNTITTTNTPDVLKKKRKKSKKVKRAENYPKYYRNAYVRYCEDVRGSVSVANPTLDSVEITKLVAANWLTLDKELKRPYLEEAQLDKDRYTRELKEYNDLNRSNEQNEEKESNKPPKKKVKKSNHHEPNTTKPPSSCVSTVDTVPVNQSHKISSENQPSTSSSSASHKDEIPKAFLTSNCELPIFTDAFLEHNKIIESELKILRKNNIEIEQQNSVLMKHIENMDNGVKKVEGEINKTKQKISQLEIYLVKLRIILSANFNSHSQPNWKTGATLENIDAYFQDLAKEAQKHQSSPPSFINKAREILKKIDFKIH